MSSDDPMGEERSEGSTVTARPGRAAALRLLAIDVSPLRASRDFRILWTGELVSSIGRQITVVALPFQVYLLSRSALAVGLIGLAQLLPLLLFSIGGGAIADRVDRRKLILATETGMALCIALLLLGALHGEPPLWYLYVVTGIQAGIAAVNSPARSAAIPNLVGRPLLPSALALNQVLMNSAMVLGPALAGALLARYGLRWTYTVDLASSAGAIVAGLLLRPLPPQREEGQPARSGWGEIREGFRFLRGRRVLLSTFLIDLNAMIFGMPRALFPVLALDVFHVGPQGLGLLHSAPAVGALLAALTAGWIGRVHRQGAAVVWAVIGWGASITLFGLSGRFFWLALVFLAVAGAADMVSAVFRGTILQLSVPDGLRGRMSAVHIAVVTGGPRLGDIEAGLVASLVSPWFSVVSGGILCLAGALGLAARFPELGRYRREDLSSSPRASRPTGGRGAGPPGGP